MLPPMSNGLQFTTWSFLEFFECSIYSVKFLVVYYTSLDSGREDARYFTLTYKQKVILFFISFTVISKETADSLMLSADLLS